MIDFTISIRSGELFLIHAAKDILDTDSEVRIDRESFDELRAAMDRIDGIPAAGSVWVGDGERRRVDRIEYHQEATWVVIDYDDAPLSPVPLYQWKQWASECQAQEEQPHA